MNNMIEQISQCGRFTLLKSSQGKFNVPFTTEFVFDSTIFPLSEAQMLMERTQTKIGRYLDDVDQIFSPFREDSFLTAFNQGRVSLEEAPESFMVVWALACQAEESSNGLFKAWQGSDFDPIGIVKGWAIERMVLDILKPLLGLHQLSAVGINGGGDMQLLTDSAVEDWTWDVGVQDPSDPNKVVASYTFRNGALATSGIEARGEHIRYQSGRIHPHLATVLTESLTIADIWATALVAGDFTRLNFDNVPGTGLVLGPQNAKRRFIIGEEVI